MGIPTERVVQVLCYSLLINVVYIFCQSDDLTLSNQCITNDDCAKGSACVDLICQDPCPGICYGNATCEIYDHVPYCACKPGFSGNPFTGCTEQAPASPKGCVLTGSKPSGRKVYKVERFFKVNYFGALVHCTTHGGRLASIESKEEIKLIKEAIGKSGIRNDQFWISGTNLPLGQWVWMSSGEPLLPDYSDWEPGEPNNAGDERCLEFYEKDNNGYMWNDKNCMEQIYPICEYFE
ncbi:perlucin-like protein [Homalodisca vitripennis]|uniref:perlucin-like protein n=1 Tax=Homalodisca vitripennis TaxID=197043 RepID=UPI001EECD189|nr:perlucin-like protein [Homalodisca vitripennis]XP_046659406.1 perlucin-like protein [Homalodisca vitripennis]